MVMISIWLFLGFILGVLALIALEGVVILYVFRRLTQTNKSTEVVSRNRPQNPLDSTQHHLPSVCQKQGVVWVLEPEKHPKIPASGEQTKKRETVEVSAVRKLAKVKDRTLILTETDGSVTKVMLKGCKVVAVSATSMPTRKWAKRFPIKIESKHGVLYQGSKVLYIYAETSCEKESWCNVLRLASHDEKEKLLWFSKLSEEFGGYLKLLSEGYPFLIKPSVGYQLGLLDKANRLDDPPSKVKQFWRKLSKKTSNLDEKRFAEKSHVFQDPSSGPSITKSAILGKMRNEYEEDSPSVSSTSSSRTKGSNHGSELSDADTVEKNYVDEGTLCWNLLVSRFFFEAKSNVNIKTALKARIQRSLSNMRLPTYFGEVNCIDVDPGNLPPYIHGMRAVPTDMNDVWAMEMDVEYSGGFVLFIEARLEVGELDSQNDMVDQNIESSSVSTSDFLEDFKHLQDDLKLSDGKDDSPGLKNAEDLKHETLRSSRTGAPTSGSRWKSILNAVAKHVSQVPLTLSIRVATLRGTIQLHIKPPPSDQVWFGFTSMPDIQFQLESSVKDHKLTNGHIASFLINRFKSSIRDTLVLPNCESVSVSWMLAEKDDWIPCSAAPLMWLNREVPLDSSSNDVPREKNIEDKKKKLHSVKERVNEDVGQILPSAAIRRSSSDSGVSSQDSKTPLLQNEEALDMVLHKSQENSEGLQSSATRYVSLSEERNGVEDDDARSKKPVGRKARMFDLGKKMGEKLEEKRRHIEEKSRTIVEKMRGP